VGKRTALSRKVLTIVNFNACSPQFRDWDKRCCYIASRSSLRDVFAVYLSRWRFCIAFSLFPVFFTYRHPHAAAFSFSTLTLRLGFSAPLLFLFSLSFQDISFPYHAVMMPRRQFSALVFCRYSTSTLTSNVERNSWSKVQTSVETTMLYY
jgi:hypothetical protein